MDTHSDSVRKMIEDIHAIIKDIESRHPERRTAINSLGWARSYLMDLLDDYGAGDE